MALLIKNISLLWQIRDADVNIVKGKEMQLLPLLNNAWILLNNGIIQDYGSMSCMPEYDPSSTTQIDAIGKSVLPCWCDSHTHLIWSGNRENELVMRLNGYSYESIAKQGGGILNSAKKLRKSSESELVEQALPRINEVISQGTGAVEIKSGYGLSIDSELKILRVIKTLKGMTPITLRSTFLGAHAIPEEYINNKEGYIKLLTKQLIPEIAKEKLADYCDVFCEKGYFTKEDTIRILNVAESYGLIPKVHAEQLSHTGGIEAGVTCNAISVDHLEYMSEKDMDILINSKTMPTILPGAQFFLDLPRPPARKAIDRGLPIAIASDYNPGSSPSGNMNLMIALASINYKLTPEEAINAATINSAYAMGVEKTHGSISKGKTANLIITKQDIVPASLPYYFGSNLIDTIILNGKVI